MSTAVPLRRRGLGVLLTAGLTLGAAATLTVVSPAAPASAATATRTSVVASASSYASAKGYTVGIAVLDTVTGELTGRNLTKAFATESVVKTMIATRLLLQGRMHGRTATRAYKMITQSDDTIASSFYGSVGGDGLITWIKEHYRIPNLGSEPRRANWWGNTRITPAGLVAFYAKVKKDKAVGPWLLNAMHHATTHGSDGVFQYFGLPSATKGAAIKQGWGADYSYSNPTADYNSTGFVNNDRYAVALLAMGPYRTYGTAIGNLLTGVAQRLLPGGSYPAPLPTVASVTTNHGSIAGGDRVTVRGRDFTGVTAVYFGTSKAASVRTLNATTLTVTTPRHAAQIVPVTVATTHGTARTGRNFGFGAVPVVSTISSAGGRAAGGQTVTITGANFRGALTAYFGATAAKIVQSSPTSLQVLAPGGKGSSPVRVRSVYGLSRATTASSYAYVSDPVITALTAPSGPASGGQTVTITGTDLDQATAVLVGRTPAQVLSGAPDSLRVVMPAGAVGDVAVRVQGRYATSQPSTYSYVAP